MNKNIVALIIIIIIFFTIPIPAYIDTIHNNHSTMSTKKWIKTYGSIGIDSCYSIQQLSDQGYIISGATNSINDRNCDGLLLKIDENGRNIWEQTYGLKDKYDYCNSIIEITNDGFIIAGVTESYGSGNKNAWLIKTDEMGNIFWNKTFGGCEYDYAQTVQQTNDGGYVLIGGTSSLGAGDMDLWIVKTDENGIMQWNKTFGGTEFDYGEDGIQTSEGGYILLGYTYSFGNGGCDTWIIKTDSNGNIQWNKTFGGCGDEIGNSIQQTVDKGYIISGGTTQEDDKFDLWILKIDTNGNEIWEKTIQSIFSINFGWCIQQTIDQGYILSGNTRGIYTGSFGVGILPQVLLLKIDEDGNIEWQKKTRFISGIGCKVQQTMDNGFIIAGYTGNYGRGRNIIIIKTDDMGSPLQNFLYWI